MKVTIPGELARQITDPDTAQRIEGLIFDLEKEVARSTSKDAFDSEVPRCSLRIFRK